MERKNILVKGDFINCPDERLFPLLCKYCDDDFPIFQICEHWEGRGKISYDINIPLVIFHSEGDEKYIDIDYFNQYGTVLHCNYKLSKTKGSFFNYWAYDYKSKLEDCNQLVNMKNSFSDKFLCLNGRPDWHRYYTLQRLQDMNLLESNLISFLNRYNNIEKEVPLEKFFDIYNGNPKYVKDLVESRKSIILDRTNEQIHINDRTHDAYIYEQTSLSLVTETYADVKRGLFVTEKSYKPLANCHFQLWIAQPGIVEFFRNLGFDMFDDFIDNSYDTIIDDIARFESVFCCLQKFLNDVKNLSDNDKLNLQQRLLDNQKKYFEMKINLKEIESWL
jgi:hypothetical protein